jgi:hypothetical protein
MEAAMPDDPNDHRVGYKRPPLHSRFPPGKSGNPKGKQKQQRNLATDLREELGELIDVREGGRSRKVTKQRALLKTLVARALQGDAKAATAVISLCAKALISDDHQAAESEQNQADQDIIDSFVRREVERLALERVAVEEEK